MSCTTTGTVAKSTVFFASFVALFCDTSRPHLSLFLFLEASEASLPLWLQLWSPGFLVVPAPRVRHAVARRSTRETRTGILPSAPIESSGGYYTVWADAVQGGAHRVQQGEPALCLCLSVYTIESAAAGDAITGMIIETRPLFILAGCRVQLLEALWSRHLRRKMLRRQASVEM